MKPTFDLTETYFNSSYASLCVLGQALWERNELDSLRNFDAISMKTCDHTPGEKLLDALLVILAGYPSLYMLNTKLRPDPVLASAWHRRAFADQSVVSRTLDAFSDDSLAQLRAVSYGYWSEHTRLTNHDWRKPLIVDLDLTPLAASKHAEGSAKGYLGKKTRLDANWHASCSIRITNQSCPNSIQAISTAATVCSLRFWPLKKCCPCHLLIVPKSFGVSTRDLVAMPISTGFWRVTTAFWPKDTLIGARLNWLSR